MRLGVVSVAPDTPLREIARIMATYRIHAVVVSEVEGDRPWGIAVSYTHLTLPTTPYV